VERAEQRPVSPSSGPPRLLFIQQDGELRKSVVSCLTQAGFAVTEAGSGSQAMQLALSSPPDLVLLDARLPDMDGAEVATRLRKAGLDQTPIVSIGRARSERGMALSVGCDGAVGSPLDLTRLPAELREFLAGKRERLRTGEEKKYLKEFSQSLVEKLEAKVQELTVANERFQRADRFKNEFMTAISHELSTPLTPLVGYLKLLHAGKLGPLDDRQKKALEATLHSADRLARTIDNLADFAALETGDYRIRLGAVDLKAMAQKVMDEQFEQAKRKRVTVHLSAPPELQPIQADGHRLEQAVANLLDNAIRFSPHGGHVLVELTTERNLVRIAVLDQGPGVPPAHQEKIFEPFQGASHPMTPSAIVSTGLGLPVARKIMQAHSGRLWVESPPKTQPPGQVQYSGAKFTVELPLQPAATA
jgi:signal transduction histidine kinase